MTITPAGVNAIDDVMMIPAGFLKNINLIDKWYSTHTVHALIQIRLQKDLRQMGDRSEKTANFKAKHNKHGKSINDNKS